MKKKHIIARQSISKLFAQICTLMFCFFMGSLFAKVDTQTNVIASIHSPIHSPVQEKKQDTGYQKKIWFRFKDEPLANILTNLATEKKINIVFPTGQQKMEDKITFELPEKITLDTAWQYMLTFLRISGYNIIPNEKFHFIVRANDKDANKQPYPLFVQTVPADLPNSDQKIRFIYYFSNIQATLSNDKVNSLEGILASTLSNNADARIDGNINGIIITDSARYIISLMEILTRFDSLSDTDIVQIIPLEYTSAITISSFFTKLLPGPNNPSIDPSIPATSSSLYFSNSIHIIPEPRRNIIITLGKKEAVDRVSSFIKKHLDVPTDSGDSILHMYYLQHLDAATFQPMLQNIVNLQGAAQQSTGTAQASEGEQYFKDVIITTDSKPETYGTQSIAGGNRLIIAARKNDWIRIKKLIEELDKPQTQIAIEALIVDISLTSDKSLGSQIRSKNNMVTNNNITGATAHLGNDILLQGGNGQTSYPADALVTNLLQQSANGSLATQATPGTFILAFNESTTNGIWLVSQILNTYNDVKILSQPFVTTLNNQPTTFQSTENRFLPGNISVGAGGVVNTYTSQKSELTVQVTPMVSNSKDINLALTINIVVWGDANSQSNRKIVTNVNVRDGEVLVLGGLTSTQVVTTDNATPILGQIPGLGWLFKSKTVSVLKDNLLIFMSPRIIQPAYLRPKDQRTDAYTARKIDGISELLVESENFELLKDPITRWFFGNNKDSFEHKKINALKNRSLITFSQDSDKFDISRSDIETTTEETQTVTPGITQTFTLPASPVVAPTALQTPSTTLTQTITKEPRTNPTNSNTTNTPMQTTAPKISEQTSVPKIAQISTKTADTQTNKITHKPTQQTQVSITTPVTSSHTTQAPAHPLTAHIDLKAAPTEEDELKNLFAQLKTPQHI